MSKSDVTLDTAACTLAVVQACWPDVTWSAQNHRYLVGKLPNDQVRRDFDGCDFAHVREAEDIAIKRGLEFLYGRFLYEELTTWWKSIPNPGERVPGSSWEFRHGHAGVTWARAPLDVRIRALYRAFEHRADEEAAAEARAESQALERADGDPT